MSRGKQNSNSKVKSSYKSKRPFNKKDKGVKEKDDFIKKDDPRFDNDPAYYVLSPEMANQASQLSFQSVLGQGNFNGYQVPTMLIALLNPNPGCTVAPNSTNPYGNWSDTQEHLMNSMYEKAGVNLMSTKIYTLLSTFSGRTATYGPQDVAIMLGAIASVDELAEHIRRAFGIILTYNPRNRTLPMELLRMLGLDADDLAANVANYRMRFNTAMTRINQIPLLENVAFIDKSRKIYQKIYQDSMSPMAQLFAFAPRSVWVLDETSYSDGSVLRPETVVSPGNPKKMSVLLTLLELQINALLESSTLQIVYADLLNMANKVNVKTWQFDYLAENYVVMPEYNEMACLQFHNLVPIGDPKSLTAPLVKDSVNQVPFTSGNYVVSDASNNEIVYNPAFQNLFQKRTSKIIDMFTSNPDIPTRIDATRYAVIPSGYSITAAHLGNSGSDLYGIFPALPDHYCAILIQYNNKENSRNLFEHPAIQQSTGLVPHQYFKLHMFGTSAPMIETYDAVFHTSGIAADLNFYTEIDYAYLWRLNNFYNLGLWEFRV